MSTDKSYSPQVPEGHHLQNGLIVPGDGTSNRAEEPSEAYTKAFELLRQKGYNVTPPGAECSCDGCRGVDRALPPEGAAPRDGRPPDDFFRKRLDYALKHRDWAAVADVRVRLDG